MNNIPINTSKNIHNQIKEWQYQYIIEQTEENNIPLYEAQNKSVEEIMQFLDIKLENKDFKNKYLKEISEMLSNDPETFKNAWELLKTHTKPLIDEIMDNYNLNKISKEEMEKQLKSHSIIYQEIKE